MGYQFISDVCVEIGPVLPYEPVSVGRLENSELVDINIINGVNSVMRLLIKYCSR